MAFDSMASPFLKFYFDSVIFFIHNYNTYSQRFYLKSSPGLQSLQNWFKTPLFKYFLLFLQLFYCLSDTNFIETFSTLTRRLIFYHAFSPQVFISLLGPDSISGTHAWNFIGLSLFFPKKFLHDKPMLQPHTASEHSRKKNKQKNSD